MIKAESHLIKKKDEWWSLLLLLLLLGALFCLLMFHNELLESPNNVLGFMWWEHCSPLVRHSNTEGANTFVPHEEKRDDRVQGDSIHQLTLEDSLGEMDGEMMDGGMTGRMMMDGGTG